MAIGASDPHDGMRRRMPGHGRCARLMAVQAELLSRALQDLAVGVVAGGAVEVVRTADLVRAGNLLQFLLVAVTAIADVGRDGAEVVRLSGQRRQLGAASLSAASSSSLGFLLIAGRHEGTVRQSGPFHPVRWWASFPAAHCSAPCGSWCRSDCCEHAPTCATGIRASTRPARDTSSRLPQPGPVAWSGSSRAVQAPCHAL